jgi:hypothetical protein
MKKAIFIFITILFSNIFQSVSAQKDSTHFRIPHQISVEFGYRYSFYKNSYLGKDGNYTTEAALMNRATSGAGILADYAWQLSGFDGKRPAIYLSVPMGYTILFPDDPASKRVGMLNYGWTIRHELAKKSERIIPFIGYGLFLSNLSVAGVPGSVSGHHTQFEGGLNFTTPTKLNYFVKLNVSYSSYPKLNYDKSLHFMYADLRAGVRF